MSSSLRLHALIKSKEKKTYSLSNEYVLAKEDKQCRQKLGQVFKELSAQMVCLSEQNIELMRKLEKQK